VIEDPDIWRAAKRLIDKYAEHAALHAAQRADQLMDERA
jgi:hypothetical protein